LGFHLVALEVVTGLSIGIPIGVSPGPKD